MMTFLGVSMLPASSNRQWAAVSTTVGAIRVPVQARTRVSPG
jgi:hypothetical protein